MRKSSKKSVAFRTLHYYLSAQWRHKGYTLTNFISTPLVILWRDVIFVYLVSDIVAKVTENPSLDYALSSLLPEVILIIVLRIIFSAALGEIRIYSHWKMEIYTMYDLANLCFDAVSAQSMQFHNDRFSGSLVSQTNKFVSAYERFMDTIIWSVTPVLVSITASLAVLFFRVPLYALALLIFVVLYIAFAFFAFRKIAPLNNKLASTENKRTGQLADSITNIASVKSYANESYERKRYRGYSDRVVTSINNLLSAELRRNISFDFVYISITAITLIFFLTGQGLFGVSVATIILVFQYTNNITNYLWSFNSIFKSINSSLGDAKEMTEILDLPDDVVDAPDAKPLKIRDSEIEFNHIYFKHVDAKTAIFEDFSLDIAPGERIGLVGTSGSGKTTLTRLLLRFADVDQGTITIDGQDIKHATQKSLRESIAYVPQETSLFHRSIADNIAYARPNAPKADIERAARLANADEFIKNLPDGYETLVGERGIKLSGGQRQRIAIARAILKDAPILILDEATSALDSESEALIQGALEKLMKGRTSLVIAHRLSTVASLDRIIVLENGKIVEQGSHGDLLAAGGAYYRLWTRQSGGFVE